MRRQCWQLQRNSAPLIDTSGSSLGALRGLNAWTKSGQVPASTAESDAMSKDLKKRGFRFVGSTICYAFMQAVGMVNDHLVTCFRYSGKR